MSKIATWKTTTGYNTENYTVTLGKPLVDCSLADLEAHPLCGSNSPLGNIAYVCDLNDLGYSSVLMNITGGAQFAEPISNGRADTWNCEKAQTGDAAKIYRRTIFVAVPTNVSINQYHLTDEANPNILLVEDIAYPNKLIYNYGNVNGADSQALYVRTCNTGVRHTCDKSITAWSGAPNQIQYTENGTTTYYYVYPIWLYVVDDDFFLISYDHYGSFGGRYQNAENSYNFITGGSSYTSFNHENGNCLFIGCNIADREDSFLNIIGADNFPDPIPNPAVFANNNSLIWKITTAELQNFDVKLSMNNSTIGGSLLSRSLNITTAASSMVELRKQQFARVGMYFAVNGEVLKPIISGGIVTGYGDVSDTSEIDKYTDLKHPVPTGPGGGGGGGDDDDPWNGVNFGGSSGGGGAFAKFYYMTSTELANLRTWMNSNDVPEGFNPMAQIIGLSQVPVAISGSAPENVEFVNSAAIYKEHQNRLVDSGVATQRGSGRTIVFNLGSVEIPRRMQQRGEPYLDYSCAIELYLPFCGVFTLDTQAVMGRTITAQLILDPTSGSITGYAWVSQGGQKLPVAYGSGQAGVDLPISAQQYGMSKAALSQANAQLSQSMAQGTMTLIQAYGGNASAMNSAYNSAASRSAKFGGTAAQQAQAGANAARGAMSMPSDYVLYNASNNVMSGFLNWGRALKEISYGNNTAVGGSFGGSYASWSNPFTAYVKIIRPKFQKPSNYNHTQAVPCVEAKTVGSCSGLIQCIGVDASGITNATSGEKDMIVAALSNGVYAGGGN